VANENGFLYGIDGFISLTLMRGCDDWVQACEIVDNIFNLDPIFQKDVAPEILAAISDAESRGGDSEFSIARDLSLAIIGRVLVDGLMVIGEIDDTGFRPWPSTIEESLREVRAEWDKMSGKLPGLGVYWLCNTEYGRGIGQEALSRWQQERKAKEGS
jgi:hypothetical protein